MWRPKNFTLVTVPEKQEMFSWMIDWNLRKSIIQAILNSIRNTIMGQNKKKFKTTG
jgi:hypothetical protein